MWTAITAAPSKPIWTILSRPPSVLAPGGIPCRPTVGDTRAPELLSGEQEAIDPLGRLLFGGRSICSEDYGVTGSGQALPDVLYSVCKVSLFAWALTKCQDTG